MAWIAIPDPNSAPSETGRRILERAHQTGEMGITAAFYAFPALGDAMLQATERAHFGETALPNIYKEMIATAISSANGCRY